MKLQTTKRAYERLMDYAAYPTASSETSDTFPSTPQQLDLGKALVKEMLALGIKDARMDSYGYVYGTVPANTPDWKGATLGFLAHIDVSDACPSVGIKPQVIRNYQGGDVFQNKDMDLRIRAEATPALQKLIGKSLVTSDGTTLLGADDKAGIAEIMTMAEALLRDPSIKHGDIKLCFSPDEEIGQGMAHVDLKQLGMDFAFTLDGDAFGGVDCETFNAAAATVTITGRSIHPGSAKDIMINAARLACEFELLLPENERPEHTDGYDGFYHLCRFEGDVENAQMHYILRDHDKAKLEGRKQGVLAAAEKLNKKYGEGRVTATITDSYANMREVVQKHWHLIDNAQAAIRKAGGTPFSTPVRGGTDGSALCFMGVPCPNLGTGAGNVHSREEYACVEEMDASVEMLVYLCETYTGFVQQA